MKIRCPKCGHIFSMGTAHAAVIAGSSRYVCSKCETLIRLEVEYEEANPGYPECEKMRQIQSKSQAIGEFLEWLGSGEADDTRFNRGVFLAAYLINNEEWDNEKGKYVLLSEDEWEVSESRLFTFSYNTEKLLAKFYGIDLNKMEQEKRAILAELRKRTEQRTTLGKSP